MLLEQFTYAIDNMKKLYSNESKTGCCIQIKSVAEIEPKMKRGLDDWNFPDDNLAFLEERAKMLEEYWKVRVQIKDDMTPCIAPHYGIAEHSAFVGGEVEFSNTTSYHHQILNELSDWKDLKYESSNMWTRMISEGLNYYKENWSDKFFIKFRGAYGPMDFANIVRGNDIFMDFYDEPEEVNSLLDFCVDASVSHFNMQNNIVPTYFNGKFCGFDIWMPNGCVGHLSDDASCMCSLDTYEEFGVPHMKKLLDSFGGSMLHIHSLGKKNIAQFASMKKIKVLEISNDPNTARGIDVLNEFSDSLKDKIVVLTVNKNELVNNKDLLASHKCILWYEAQTIAEAQEIVALVRKEFN